MQLSDLRTGDRVKPDSPHWDCLRENMVRTVQRASDGALFIRCREGRHYLDGQTGDDGALVGLVVLRCEAPKPI